MTSKKTVSVIIPTIASPYIQTAIESVLQQKTEYEVIPHIFADGPAANVSQLLENYSNGYKILQTVLGENVGKVNGQSFYGHRVYAASAHLSNSDYVFFLDEDNFYEPNHVQFCVDFCERKNLDFCFSLRSIHSQDGKFICLDNCESLGFFPVWNNEANGYHVDTSSYCFRRDFLIQAGHYWHWGYAADRRFFAISQKMMIHDGSSGQNRIVRYGCTGRSSLCYRLDGNENSVKREFFEYGNSLTQELDIFEERVNYAD